VETAVYETLNIRTRNYIYNYLLSEGSMKSILAQRFVNEGHSDGRTSGDGECTRERRQLYLV